MILSTPSLKLPGAPAILLCLRTWRCLSHACTVFKMKRGLSHGEQGLNVLPFRFPVFPCNMLFVLPEWLLRSQLYVGLSFCKVLWDRGLWLTDARSNLHSVRQRFPLPLCIFVAPGTTGSNWGCGSSKPRTCEIGTYRVLPQIWVILECSILLATIHAYCSKVKEKAGQYACNRLVVILVS